VQDSILQNWEDCSRNPEIWNPQILRFSACSAGEILSERERYSRFCAIFQSGRWVNDRNQARSR